MMKKNKIIISFLMLIIISLLGSAKIAFSSEYEESSKLTPDLDNGIDIFEVCSACHLPEGWGKEDGTFPQIAGQHFKVCVKQVFDIRSGDRNAPTMYPFVLPNELGGIQDIADVCGYVEKLPMTSENGRGDGTNLEVGEKIYKERCSSCHGENGEGNNDKFIARIHGQHYKYLFNQQILIKKGKRANADKEMLDHLKQLSEDDIKALSDYISRLSPPAEMVAPPGWLNPDFE